MRILFLDVDGVLNPLGGTCNLERGPEHLAVDLCARLERVVRYTKAAIVLSSAWRYKKDGKGAPANLHRFERWLHERGCPSAEVIGRTPLGSEMGYELVPIPGHEPAMMYAGERRGHEIERWLAGTVLDVKAFAIVDDLADVSPLEHRLVRTACDRGLEDEHVERLIALLSEGA